MVYKLCNTSDLDFLPPVDSNTFNTLYEYVSVLTNQYGHYRNPEKDDGGIVLYATPNTNPDEIKTHFDYTQCTIEYANRSADICSALYILRNDYVIVIVMSISDAPSQITEAFEEGY